MFTHNPITPVRLEIVVDLLLRNPLGYARGDIYRLLTPEPLALELSPGSGAKTSVSAVIELEIAEEVTGRTGDKVVKIREPYRKMSARDILLHAFDIKVLSCPKIEPYFALFYAFFLGLGKGVYHLKHNSGEDWAKKFNRDLALPEGEGENQFNKFKHDKLSNWFCYVGLGWSDPFNVFQANPFARILRSLPGIFGANTKMSSGDFMVNLGQKCPELDGGAIFRIANRNWSPEEKYCSLGLSHALIELHEEGVVLLDCPADCQEWSLKEAEPPRDDFFKGDRFASIEWRRN